MRETAPFVVTVASEKGGVGKTTIATNLAVYLKALREDLPVAIASFDNHFSVDSMFAIGGRRGGSVAGLFAGEVGSELATFGEYGVQYFGSERTLEPPDADPRHLSRALAASGLEGILILDTRPILDYFTHNALLAADLVLVPVKDRPSLMNVAALERAVRTSGGDLSRLWLLPSLIDARLRLRGDIGVREFLAFSARERGYQVLDIFMSKSPKVEGLSTSLTARVRPVLTDARGTMVHRQLRELAEFVLARFDASGGDEARSLPEATNAPPCVPGSPRKLAVCPVCGRVAGRALVHPFQGVRRKSGFLHADCLEGLLEGIGWEPLDAAPGGFVFEAREGEEGALQLDLHQYDLDGGRLMTARIEAPLAPGLVRLLRAATGRSAEETVHEALLVEGTAQGPPGPDGAGRSLESITRWRRVLRDLAGKERAGG